MSDRFNLLNAAGEIISTAVGNYQSPEMIRFVGKTIDGQVVASIENATPPLTDEEIAYQRRVERDAVLANTVDRVNHFWYDTLTVAEKAELVVWRQAWLDYPETGIKPDLLEMFGA